MLVKVVMVKIMLVLIITQIDKKARYPLWLLLHTSSEKPPVWRNLYVKRPIFITFSAKTFHAINKIYVYNVCSQAWNRKVNVVTAFRTYLMLRLPSSHACFISPINYVTKWHKFVILNVICNFLKTLHSKICSICEIFHSIHCDRV